MFVTEPDWHVDSPEALLSSPPADPVEEVRDDLRILSRAGKYYRERGAKQEELLAAYERRILTLEAKAAVSVPIMWLTIVSLIWLVFAQGRGGH
jgi:hypothetical protein